MQLTDTAGLREASDEVERIGIDRAREELRGADVVLLVIDRSRPLGEEEKALLGQPGAPLVVALNKSDLDAVTTDAEVHKLSPQAKIVDTCAKNGEGVETLRQTLYETALRGASPEEAYLTNERHIQAARTAAEAIGRALEALNTHTLDCAALDLRAAWEALGAITGENTTEDIVDRIFAKFCLGK